MIVRTQTLDIGHYGMLLPLEIDLEHEELVLVITDRGSEPMQERRIPIDLKAAVKRDTLRCGCAPTEK